MNGSETALVRHRIRWCIADGHKPRRPEESPTCVRHRARCQSECWKNVSSSRHISFRSHRISTRS